MKGKKTFEDEGGAAFRQLHCCGKCQRWHCCCDITLTATFLKQTTTSD